MPSIKNALDYLLHDRIRFMDSCVKNLWFFFPDKMYLRLRFRFSMGYWMDFNNPKTFNEKLQYLKLRNRNDLYTSLVDKAAVKSIVADKIGWNHIIPTIAVWSDPREINWEKLPDQFVLKTTHGGGNGSVLVCKDKKSLNRSKVINFFTKSLKYDIYPIYREWPYKNIPRKIIAENYLEDETGELIDYKFFCFNGRANCVMLCLDRSSGDPKFYFFNRDWQLLRLNIRGKNAPADFTIAPPENMEKMFEMADRLSEGFPFVRVDLYNVNGLIYFGELTFFPASGFDSNLLPETDEMFGDLIKL